MRLGVPGPIGDFDRDLPALFEVNAARARYESSCTTAESRCYLLTIDRKPAESRAANAKEKVARFRRCQEPGPLHAEGILSRDFFRELLSVSFTFASVRLTSWAGAGPEAAGHAACTSL